MSQRGTIICNNDPLLKGEIERLMKRRKELIAELSVLDAELDKKSPGINKMIWARENRGQRTMNSEENDMA